jgi:hypothetical protein
MFVLKYKSHIQWWNYSFKYASENEQDTSYVSQDPMMKQLVKLDVQHTWMDTLYQ